MIGGVGRKRNDYMAKLQGFYINIHGLIRYKLRALLRLSW